MLPHEAIPSPGFVATHTLRGVAVGMAGGLFLYPLLGVLGCEMAGYLIQVRFQVSEHMFFIIWQRLVWLGWLFVLGNGAFFGVFYGWSALRARLAKRPRWVRMLSAAGAGGIGGALTIAVYFNAFRMKPVEYMPLLALFAALGIFGMSVAEWMGGAQVAAHSQKAVRNLCRAMAWPLMRMAGAGFLLVIAGQATFFPDTKENAYPMLLLAVGYPFFLWMGLCGFAARGSCSTGIRGGIKA